MANDPMFKVIPSRNRFGKKRWRWNLLAANAEVVASSESYNSKEACLHSIEVIQQLAPHAAVRVT